MCPQEFDQESGEERGEGARTRAGEEPNPWCVCDPYGLGGGGELWETGRDS